MTLAVILSDLNSLPHPPDDIPDSSAVFTPLSFRHFPYQTYKDARKAASKKFAYTGVPTLAELCAHVIRTSPRTVGPHAL